MGRQRTQMSGLFDFFRKKKKPSEGSLLDMFREKPGLPAIRPVSLPAIRPEERKQLSIFDIFLPPAQQEEKGLILPPILRPPAMFEFMQPSPPPPVTPHERVEEAEVWEEMFQESETLPTPSEILEFLKPSAQLERRPLDPSEWPYGEPPVWTMTNWQMPTTFELAHMIRDKWDLPAMFEYVLQNTVDSPHWRRQVDESSHTGEPAVLDVELITQSRDPYSDMAKFLGIPEYVIDLYARHPQPTGVERLSVEVLQPMLDRVAKALDVWKPTPELTGWFELEPDEDFNFWVKYKEAKFPQEG